MTDDPMESNYRQQQFRRGVVALRKALEMFDMAGIDPEATVRQLLDGGPQVVSGTGAGKASLVAQDAADGAVVVPQDQATASPWFAPQASPDARAQASCLAPGARVGGPPLADSRDEWRVGR